LMDLLYIVDGSDTYIADGTEIVDGSDIYS
jgi:hypothetical protein